MIMAIIGIPMNLLLGPLHFLCGGNAANDEKLSYWSMGNVANGSWLYWIHAIVVWGVVFAVQINIYSAMDKFLLHRYRWLRSMDETRACTVMVEGIPEELRSDKKLETFFDDMFPGGAVKCAFVVKNTSVLKPLVDREMSLKLNSARLRLSRSIHTFPIPKS